MESKRLAGYLRKRLREGEEKEEAGKTNTRRSPDGSLKVR